jgi:hypothetical protein
MTVNGRKTGLILCAWLLLPGLAAAQSDATAPERAPAQRTQMSEDIEVLRRLLNSKLQSQYQPVKQLAEAGRWEACVACHSTSPQGVEFWQRNVISQPRSVQLWNNRQSLAIPGARWSDLRFPNDTVWIDLNTSPHWLLSQVHPGLADRLLDTEGVYLKGQGVVYTLTLPLPKPKADGAKPVPRPVSDWDRARRELHNEKPEPEPKERPHKEPSLTEIILQVLAENGHHFGQLGENEGLTVVVTFRGEEPAPAKAAEAPPTQTAPAAQKPAGSSQPGNPGQDYELLGDLHLKQGKPTDAEHAYRQALGESKNQQRTLALWGKIAQALLSEGKVEEAEHVLEQALREKKKDPAAPSQPAQPRDGPTAALPTKLIITAGKKLLDQAAGGKMSLDEFQKAAAVEYVNVAAPPE